MLCQRSRYVQVFQSTTTCTPKASKSQSAFDISFENGELTDKLNRRFNGKLIGVLAVYSGFYVSAVGNEFPALGHRLDKAVSCLVAY